ncbi:MAG: hypothetical protein D6743_15725, partial [Calditrichaeota bacterium]
MTGKTATPEVTMSSKGEKLPFHFWLGLALIAVCWPLNWGLSGLRTQWLFFPLWVGFCLTIDALVWLRKGSSLLTRNPRKYIGLFLCSAPAWWLFELLNLRLQNWIYLGRPLFGTPLHILQDSLSFSTVMPAVFGAAELAGTFRWVRNLGPGPRVSPTPPVLTGLFLAGWIMLAALLIWPQIFFGLVWLSIYFILEPLNFRLGHRTLIRRTSERDWRPIVALWVGCLICGFFWEMWNFYSYPKW